MSNYTKTTDFEAKDSLPTGDSGKIIRGSEFETEFDAISTAIATKADTAGPTFTGTLTFETISDGTIGVTAFVDEDDMSSDSATLVPTQQSVKAYVDAQVTAQDLDFQADTGGALSIDLDSETLTFTGGTGIDTSGSGNAVTFAIDSTVTTLTGTQTLTNKTLTTPVISSISNTGTLTLPTSTDTLVGRATTDTLTNKTLTSPVISTISNTGTITLPTSTDTLVGRATTDTLTNKTLTSAVLNTGVSGTAVLDEDNMASNSATQLATQQSIKAYVDSQVGANNELSEVLANGNTTGGTDIAFGDNDKAIFGAGSDLQIYHDGTDSYITDTTGGNLFINEEGVGYLMMKGSDLYFRNPSNADMIHAQSGGYVKLYYNGSEKLATTSAGIDVTGTVTADGLTVDGDATIGGSSGGKLGIAGQGINAFATTTEPSIYRTGSGGSDIFSAAGHLVIQPRTSAARSVNIATSADGVSTLKRASFADNGDISFYEDTGTTAKLFWDASAESLGIGTSSPDHNLRVSGDARLGNLHFKTSDFGTGGTGKTIYADGAGTGLLGFISTTAFDFSNGSTSRLRIDSSGNVGIGTSSPSGLLHIASTGASNIKLEDTDNGFAATELNIENGGRDFKITTPQDTIFVQGSTEAMRILSGGNVGIGTSSPATALEVKSDGAQIQVSSADYDVALLGRRGSSGVDLDKGYMRLRDTGTTKVAIDSAGSTYFNGGNVGIGTSSPAQKLHIEGSSHTRLQITSSTTTDAAIYLGDTADADVGALVYDNAQNSMKFLTNASERMRIDSDGDMIMKGGRIKVRENDDGNDAVVITRDADEGYVNLYSSGSQTIEIRGNGNSYFNGGNVGIGTSSPARELHVASAQPDFRMEDTDGTDQYAEFTESNGSLFIGSRNGASDGQILFRGLGGGGSNEYMRIDSSGNVLVGKTSADTATVGAAVFNYGMGAFTRASSHALDLNRTTSDGSIVNFRKDNTTVGSIGTYAGDLTIGDDDIGIRFDTGSGLVPWDLGATATGGSARDAAIDIGVASARFKDLYLSGNTYADAQVFATGIGHKSDTNTFINFPQSDRIVFTTGGSERARFDASGNLLVGTTDTFPGDGDTNTGISLTASGSAAFSRDGFRVVSVNRNTSDGTLIEFNKDGSEVGSIGSDSTDLFIGTGDTGIRFNDAVNGVLPYNTSTGQIDATLDLGFSTVRWKDLYLSGTASAATLSAATTTSTNVLIKGGDGNSKSIVFQKDTGSTQQAKISTVGDDLRFTTGPTSERMRLDSSGNLLVGKTVADNATAGITFFSGGIGSFVADGSRSGTFVRKSSDGSVVEFRRDATTVGSISVTTSATAYNTSSDQRLKDNIVDAPSASDDIDAIQVRSFDWKADGSHQKYGMVAQELQSIAPEAVTGDADSDDMMGVDYSKLVPMMMKEIQSLRARVAQLEGVN